MSIISHLQSLSSELIITEEERGLINQYMGTSETRLLQYFNNNQIAERFPFGSFTRKTLMPRKADSRSDVDYMVVFNPTKPTHNLYGPQYTYYEPSTYISWLKSFVDARYSTSEIYTSNPTVVLQLSNFKIELVPAIKDALDTYSIPAPASSYTRWMTTTPNSFNESVRRKNAAENSLIRPLIRLMKYWNAQNGYVYSSYELEQKIVGESYYSCTTIWVYLRKFVSGLNTYSLNDTQTNKVSRLKKICADAYTYETSPWAPAGSSGEEEMKKAFPVFNR